MSFVVNSVVALRSGGFLVGFNGDDPVEMTTDGDSAEHVALAAWLMTPGNKADSYVRSLDDVKVAAHADLLAQINAALSPFVAGYAEEEVSSWSFKAADARAHLAGTPSAFIAMEAEELGVSADARATEIVARADAYTALISRVAGIRSKAQTEIDAAATTFDATAAVDTAAVRLATVIAAASQ